MKSKLLSVVLQRHKSRNRIITRSGRVNGGNSLIWCRSEEYKDTTALQYFNVFCRGLIKSRFS